jgi:methylated-DNA-[protein]-cysteine S-methyltransferase
MVRRLNHHKAAYKMIQETIVVPPIELTLFWGGDVLLRIGLAWAEGPALEPVRSTSGKELASALERYLRGERVQWPDLPLDFGTLSPFTGAVLSTLRKQVGWGKLITYGQLASLSGRPRAARAVGAVMRNNRWPLVVPCHRVIGGTGGLTGFGPGLPMKEYLLGLESSWPLKMDPI